MSGKALQHSATSSLARLDVPNAAAAEERTWSVVERAFAEHRPQPRPRRGMVRAAVALGAIGLAAGVVASPPGRAVVDRVREVVGVERAQPALFELPSPGRMLVSSDAGVWVVEADGSKRLLGRYREASWSPFGRFVVATRTNELAALEPDGDVRWTLARRNVLYPRWTGTQTDTRIAYLTGRRLHVVGGDGRNDRVVATGVSAVAPAWRPRGGFVLTYVDGAGAIVSEDVERRRVLWRRAASTAVRELQWSADGRRLLVRYGRHVDVRTRDGRLFTGIRPSSARVTDSTVRAPLHENTHALERQGDAEILHNGEPGGRLFAGSGAFADLAWSPDGRWLLVGWPAADQWVFVRPGGGIRAVSDVTVQFRSRSFPRVEGWCCSE